MKGRNIGLALAAMAATALSAATPGAQAQPAPQATKAIPSRFLGLFQSQFKRLEGRAPSRYRKPVGKRYSASVRQHQRHATKARNQAAHRARSRA